MSVQYIFSIAMYCRGFCGGSYIYIYYIYTHVSSIYLVINFEDRAFDGPGLEDWMCQSFCATCLCVPQALLLEGSQPDTQNDTPILATFLGNSGYPSH